MGNLFRFTSLSFTSGFRGKNYARKPRSYSNGPPFFQKIEGICWSAEDLLHLGEALCSVAFRSLQGLRTINNE